MESTKVISLRISYDRYAKMILECDAKGINVSEFIERKIAAAGAVKEFKKEIAEKIESAMNSLDRSTTHAKIKLRSILEFIGKFS
jgi:hypothetical protein